MRIGRGRGLALAGLPVAAIALVGASSPPRLRVDPLLVAQAAQVWDVVAGPDNPLWPGWDATATPLLLYLPGEQDVLINHPAPPAGFVACAEAVGFPGGRILVRDGPTLIEWDGQNTSLDVEGVRTLVVADPLSSLRVRVSSLLLDRRAAEDKVRALALADLAQDPYDQLALVAHEAFHVHQDERAPDKAADELLLLAYPVLSVANNVGFALEGRALAAALRARDDATLRRQALRWLAVRQDRRAQLGADAVAYEDGTEFAEGLAKYVEYRLFAALEGRPARPELKWVRGFHGFADLAPQRERLVDEMLRHMSGEVAVNDDPYGTAPLRMRLYYSGMAAGVLLDRFAPGWHDLIFAPGTTLTGLLAAALRADADALARELAAARADTGHAALVAAKTRLADEGRARAAELVAAIEDGPGIAVVVDYSQLSSPSLRLAFTPFGITAVDAQRTVFTQVPVAVAFGEVAQVAETEPAPLLRDTGRALVRFRLPAGVTRAQVAGALGTTPAAGEPVDDLALRLPGAHLTARRARLTLGERELLVVLQEPAAR